MNSSRRRLLQSALLGGGAAALSSCDRTISAFSSLMGQNVPPHLAVCDGAEIDPEFHLLSRAAFGPWPGDVARVKEMGRDKWIEQQLDHESINDAACELRAHRFDALYVHPGEAYNWKKPALHESITRHAMLRAIYSQRQLFEVMVEFWGDHLNIDLEKGDCVYFKPADDRDVIRRHALGNFRDLIRASATSPAMLVYLDGRSNKVTKDKPVPNENYARELLELHTLGVHGGYTQDDVRAAARCLSGWTVNLLKDRQGTLKAKLKGGLGGIFSMFSQPSRGVSFFSVDNHDDGEKKVLGVTIPAGGGEDDLERLVDIVCAHPSTARFIATKLCRRFVSYDPPETLVTRVAAEFTKTRGDIKSLLRVILKSDEFIASRGVLLKRPYRFVVSALRATGADTQANAPVTEWLHRMGQPLFQFPTPDGYPDNEKAWVGSLFWRWNFALALAGGSLDGATVDFQGLRRSLGAPHEASAPEFTTQFFSHFAGRRPSAEEIEAVRSVGHDADMLGIMLASPAFQRC